MNRLVYILVLLIVDFSLLAQPGWNWPENKSEAEEKNVLYTDYLKQGDCESSL